MMEEKNESLEQILHEERVEIIRKHDVFTSVSDLPPKYEIYDDVNEYSHHQSGYSVTFRPMQTGLGKKFPWLNNIYVVKYATFDPLVCHKRFGLGQKWAERTMLKKACYVAEKAMEYRKKRLEEEASQED